ncbi:hypothetical protein NDU88_004223 [Pleurodeles waltl]|uniref:Uncharacterized protein n=1 Tax=Pleurodeles waltl TaxID=8319 RepID=A0AAV7UEH2_PLEWA|nr:hypothetical protein NDU88_004223 [Pleurodeles waltl]
MRVTGTSPKEISGRKIRISPEHVVLDVWEVLPDLPVIKGTLRTSAGREDETRSGSPDIGEAYGPGFGVQEVCPVVEGEPSTSRGAGFVELEDIEEEFLDYEDEEEAEEVDRGHRRAVQKGGTLDVLHKVNKKAVQSDHRVGGDRQVFFTGNLPRDALPTNSILNVKTRKDKKTNPEQKETGNTVED